MYCANCGVELGENDKFCKNCGAKIDVATNENDVNDNSLSIVIKNVHCLKEYNNEDCDIEKIETVKFGNYYINDTTGKIKEPIEWIVLYKDKINNKALLLSKYGLDNKEYHNENELHFGENGWLGYKYDHVTWEECTLRKWLNDTFINEAFNEEEKLVIVDDYINNIDLQWDEWISEDGYNEDGSKKGRYEKRLSEAGEKTKDKVFLLSYEETEKYFMPDHKLGSGGWGNYSRESFPTKYLESKIDYWEKNKRYLLRSPGTHKGYCGIVDQWGRIYGNKDGQSGVEIGDNSVAIRPAMWVKI